MPRGPPRCGHLGPGWRPLPAGLNQADTRWVFRTRRPAQWGPPSWVWTWPTASPRWPPTTLVSPQEWRMRSCSGHTFGPWQESRVRRSSGIPVGGTSDASELATGGPPPPQLGVTTTSAQPMTHVTCVLHYYTVKNMRTAARSRKKRDPGIPGAAPRGHTQGPQIPRSRGPGSCRHDKQKHEGTGAHKCGMKAQGPINAA